MLFLAFACFTSGNGVSEKAIGDDLDDPCVAAWSTFLMQDVKAALDAEPLTEERAQALAEDWDVTQPQCDHPEVYPWWFELYEERILSPLEPWLAAAAETDDPVEADTLIAITPEEQVLFDLLAGLRPVYTSPENAAVAHERFHASLSRYTAATPSGDLWDVSGYESARIEQWESILPESRGENPFANWQARVRLDNVLAVGFNAPDSALVTDGSDEVLAQRRAEVLWRVVQTAPRPESEADHAAFIDLYAAPVLAWSAGPAEQDYEWDLAYQQDLQLLTFLKPAELQSDEGYLRWFWWSWGAGDEQARHLLLPLQPCVGDPVWVLSQIEQTCC